MTNRLEIIKGDITKQVVGAIVNATNYTIRLLEASTSEGKIIL